PPSWRRPGEAPTRGGSSDHLVGAGIPASAVLRFAPMLLHILAQGTVDICLITLTLGPSRSEPFDHISIDPQRDLPFDWRVQQAAARSRPVADLRHVAGINLLLGQCRQHVQLSL